MKLIFRYKKIKLLRWEGCNHFKVTLIFLSHSWLKIDASIRGPIYLLNMLSTRSGWPQKPESYFPAFLVKNRCFSSFFLPKRYIFFQPLVTKNIIYSSFIYKVIHYGRSSELITVCDESYLKAISSYKTELQHVWSNMYGHNWHFKDFFTTPIYYPYWDLVLFCECKKLHLW